MATDSTYAQREAEAGTEPETEADPSNGFRVSCADLLAETCPDAKLPVHPSAKNRMESFQSVIEKIGFVVDAAGVLVIVVGIVIASICSLRPSSAADGQNRYSQYRQRIGRSILLGLELLVAGDIIRTVAVSPTLQDLAVLAVIVLIRTFLSFTLELEISGRWPWQSKKA